METLALQMSFIIPVYNKCSYLAQCIESILHQPIGNYEIILIDNGSTDGSSAVCNQYQETYQNVRVIHLKTNCGPGMARNYGLEAAKGKYVYFIDADDYLVKDSFAAIYLLLEETQADAVYPNRILLKKQDKEPQEVITSCHLPKSSVYYSLQEAYEKVLYNNFPRCMWNLIIKKEIFLSGRIDFPAIIYGDDCVTLFKVLLAVHSIAVLDCPVYCYREYVVGSITSLGGFRRNEKEYILSIVDAIEQLMQIVLPKDIVAEKIRSYLVKNLMGDALRFYIGINSAKEISDVESRGLSKLEIYAAQFGTMTEQKDLYSHINQYGVSEGFKITKKDYVQQIYDLCQKRTEIYIMPASQQNIYIAAAVERCGGKLKGFLDNALDLFNEKRGEWNIFTPNILAQRIAEGKKEQIGVIICSSKEDTCKALERQLKDMGLLEYKHFISLK